MKIFISHSSKDKEFVRKFKKDLKLNYIDTWFDEDELEYGDSLLDKLNSAISLSSHFLIVLSPNSVKSDWVKFELENALKYVEDEVIQKIIPIFYRHCEIPFTLKKAINIDLSNETVYLRHGELELYGDNYYRQLNRLVFIIRRKELELKEIDKNTLLGKYVLEIVDKEQISYTFRVQGFKSVSNFLANQIPAESIRNYREKDIEKFIPVVLPKQLEKVFSTIKFGDSIVFQNTDRQIISANFARFSTANNLSIPQSVRTFLDIGLGIHKITIDLESKIISVGKITDN